MKKLYLFVTLIAGLLLMLSIAQAQNSMSATVEVSTVPVNTHPSQGDVRAVEGASTTLVRSGDGIWVHMVTNELEDGHVYTLWLVKVDQPENCETNPCAPQFLVANEDLTGVNTTWAGGIIADAEGRSEFSYYLPVGEVAEGWTDIEFSNPMGAEVHVIINDHGPLIPEMAGNMINTYRGGCTDESLPGFFPDTAKSDGQPGPNTCRMIQFSIFLP